MIAAAPPGIAPGARCQIVSVHHPAMRHYLGRVIVVVKVNPDFGSVWAHDDKPVTYRTNRFGRRVIASEPRCIQSIYGFEQLRLLPYGSLTSY